MYLSSQRSIPRLHSKTLALLLAAFVSLDASMPAQEGKTDKGDGEKPAKKAPSYDLIAWGQLKPIKDESGYYELSYTAAVKGRRRKQKALVKIGDDLKVLEDSRITPKQIEVGANAYVLGQVRETSTVDPTVGITKTKYDLTSVEALLVGRGIKIDPKYRDPKNEQLRWYSSKVLEPKSKRGIELEIGENRHVVTFAKRVSLLSREPVKPSKVLDVKKAVYAFVLANETDERPEGKKSDEKMPAFETSRVILLDPSAVKLNVYARLFP